MDEALAAYGWSTNPSLSWIRKLLFISPFMMPNQLPLLQEQNSWFHVGLGMMTSASKMTFQRGIYLYKERIVGYLFVTILLLRHCVHLNP